MPPQKMLVLVSHPCPTLAGVGLSLQSSLQGPRLIGHRGDMLWGKGMTELVFSQALLSDPTTQARGEARFLFGAKSVPLVCLLVFALRVKPMSCSWYFYSNKKKATDISSSAPRGHMRG